MKCGNDGSKTLRVSGGVVNSRIVLGATKWFIKAKDRPLLKQHGGTIVLNKGWATSLMRRMGLVRRKGTKGVHQLPDDFNNMQAAYVERIATNVRNLNIPDECASTGIRREATTCSAGTYFWLKLL